MPCEHTQPLDLIRMADDYTRANNLPVEKLEGIVFGFGENVDTAGHKSIYMEVTRKNGSWSVTKIDRNPDRLSEGLLGLRIVK